ncbi:hypothetical protein DT037_03800 [Pseudomonas fulva]|uniref:Lar family restriction alleviation protein n=1 Tax=Pseudomonas fulva TaxID=47880 RepID=UPI0015F73994|nr:Lar family restriction alleviation protein [Pseudomonas fulva]MBA5706197.1 hypothetical protein [Pseudomonas fulva]
MPTENRSSNTEMAAKLSPCPFCGQQDAFVEQLDSDASVVICQGRIDEYSACLARGPVGVQQHECEDKPGHDQAVKEWNKRAAAVHHPDPIAWMVGTAFWWTEEEAERDAAETGLPIVGLGLITDAAEVEQLRAALKFYADRDRFAEDIGTDWDSVSGEPANILWHEHEAWFLEDGSIARAALSGRSEQDQRLRIADPSANLIQARTTGCVLLPRKMTQAS